MITIDGVNYKASWVKESLEQTADIINGKGSGRLQGSYNMYLEYLGTFFNHKAQLRRENNCTDAEWANLFLVLANPINEHTISFPFGVDKKITQKVYIAKISRKLIFDEDKHEWSRVYDVEFPAKIAGWRPNGSIRGLQ